MSCDNRLIKNPGCDHAIDLEIIAERLDQYLSRGDTCYRGDCCISRGSALTIQHTIGQVSCQGLHNRITIHRLAG